MRIDENGEQCPSTLREYLDFCLALGGKNCRAVQFLEDKIAACNGDDEVIVPDLQMRMLLLPMLTEKRLK